MENCQLDDASFVPDLMPPGLTKLNMPYADLGDRWAAHLAGMNSLIRDIAVYSFDLSSSLVLPEGCSWRSFTVSHLALRISYGVVVRKHWPSNWPQGARMVAEESDLSWTLENADDAIRAKDLAITLASLPLRNTDGSMAGFHLELKGAHGYPFALSPLSPFITSICPSI